jgi:ATP-binding cassette subfamily F protein 3
MAPGNGTSFAVVAVRSGRVLRVEDGACELFSTNFRDWSAQEQLRLEAAAATARTRVATSAKEGARRNSFEENKAARREQERKKRRVVELESDIAQSEARVDAMRAKLREHSPDEWEKLAGLAQQEQELQRKIDSMLMEWARLSEEVEA